MSTPTFQSKYRPGDNLSPNDTGVLPNFTPPLPVGSTPLVRAVLFDLSGYVSYSVKWGNGVYGWVQNGEQYQVQMA